MSGKRNNDLTSLPIASAYEVTDESKTNFRFPYKLKRVDSK